MGGVGVHACGGSPDPRLEVSTFSKAVGTQPGAPGRVLEVRNTLVPNVVCWVLTPLADVTPAIEAGISQHAWFAADIAMLTSQSLELAV